MQEKSFFLVKNQQVVSWKNGKGRGLTGNVRVIVWNYEENGPGSGDFFETPVQVRPCSCKHSSFAFVLRHDSVGVSLKELFEAIGQIIKREPVDLLEDSKLLLVVGDKVVAFHLFTKGVQAEMQSAKTPGSAFEERRIENDLSIQHTHEPTGCPDSRVATFGCGIDGTGAYPVSGASSHVVSPVVCGRPGSLNLFMSKSSSCSYQFHAIIDHGQYDDRPAKVGRSHFFHLPPRSLKPISDEIILK